MVNCPLPEPGFEAFPETAQEHSIPRRFESQVARYGDRIAVEEGSRSWTYRSLNEAANRAARAILGAEADRHPVALCFSPGFNAIAAILGVLKAGRVWVPLMPDESSERLRLLVTESGSTLVLTDSKHMDSVQMLARDRVKILNIETIGRSGAADDLDLEIAPDTPSNIIFTAGSTGRPKGVVHTHAVVLNNIKAHTNTLYITAKDRISQVASYTTLAGTSSLFRPLLNGATVLPFNIAAEGAGNVAHWLIEKRVTVCQIVPTLFRSIVQCIPDSTTFPDMRILHLGGEPVYRSDALAFRKHFPKTCWLVHNLGSSEAPTIRQFFVGHDLPLEEERLPVGFPVADREVMLIGEDGKLVEFDQVGEVVVRSRYLAQGYWRQPELTRQMFQLDPSAPGMRRFRTGDLGSMSRDGCLTLHGRKDSQVKVRGYRVDTQEVEAVLLSIDGIEQAAVVSSETESARLIAYVVTSPGGALTEASIHERLRQKLAHYMNPAEVVFIPKLPLTATGKLDRRALQGARTRRSSAISPAPASDMEKLLCESWSEVLERPVGVSDRFLDLGGDSLSGAKVLARLESQLGIRVTLKDLFERPTVAAMAEWLDTLADSGSKQ